MKFKETIEDVLLERSMNCQSRMMTVDERFRYAADIDKKDDVRRQKSFNYDKWNEDMMKSFIRDLKKAKEEKKWEAVDAIFIKMENFQKEYFPKRKKLQDEELLYEKLDDHNRDWSIDFVIKCIEKIKNENSVINLKMMADELEKLKTQKK